MVEDHVTRIRPTGQETNFSQQNQEPTGKLGSRKVEQIKSSDNRIKVCKYIPGLSTILAIPVLIYLGWINHHLIKRNLTDFG